MHGSRFEALVRDGLAAEDASLAPKNHAGPHVYVVADAHLARKHRAIADR